MKQVAAQKAHQTANPKVNQKIVDKYLPKPEQSIELLKELHILTADGKLNQDTRRKLKQVQHLLGFIAPLLAQSQRLQGAAHVVDHGAGKSYLGFLLYDSYYKSSLGAARIEGSVTSVEARAELVQRSTALAQRLGFEGMRFLNASIAGSADWLELPQRIDVVTALHACDAATDDAIAFGLKHQVANMVLVPCCQAQIAACLRASKPQHARQSASLMEMWRRPLHTREFGSQLTNVLRCLQLESHGYDVTVTELVGWEHSLKNELIVATRSQPANASMQKRSYERLTELLEMTGLAQDPALRQRFLSATTNAVI